jgi:methylmalonyl-CoA mutase C-terminal domain/subunit
MALEFMMHEKPIRVLIAKPGLDGHESGAKVVARALVDAGMEVIYTGIRPTPHMIASAALQEAVDVIGLSILSGAHKELCARVVALLKVQGMEDVPIIVGGIIPDSDIPKLKSMGIKEVFDPGSTTGSIVACVRDLVGKRKVNHPEGDDH